MRFMMPNTSVSPAAIRNSMTPSCRPFSAWNATSDTSIVMRRRVRAGPRRPRRLPLHRAVLGIGVAVIGQHGAAAELEQLAVLAHGLIEVVVLDRELVVVELEWAAHRLEGRLAEGVAQRVLVVELAAGRLDGGVDQAC